MTNEVKHWVEKSVEDVNFNGANVLYDDMRYLLVHKKSIPATFLLLSEWMRDVVHKVYNEWCETFGWEKCKGFKFQWH